MRKITTLTGKNIPRLSVARGGWPEHSGKIGIDGEWRPTTINSGTITEKALSDFTRVCDDMGLKLRDEK